ncbi:hypothetical protein AB0F72_08715 [Actinoplanes sp. NPDC023936]|uniref:hypothetical protein n=1 Tax=Actinoplanes sp. NPDC023936 TaxID=3154910 RepID=UPI0033F30C0B
MFRFTKDTTEAATVPPLHYVHCREDVNAHYKALGGDYDYDRRRALGVVDEAEVAGVSVWKVLPKADGFSYEERMRLADLWRDAGRGPAADREEFYS